MKDPSQSIVKIPLLCRIGWHRWSWWESKGHALYHNTGHFQKVMERVCADCGRTKRKFGGWSTLAECNEEGKLASRIARS